MSLIAHAESQGEGTHQHSSDPHPIPLPNREQGNALVLQAYVMTLALATPGCQDVESRRFQPASRSTIILLSIIAVAAFDDGCELALAPAGGRTRG
jgi:hypothetical protein